MPELPEVETMCRGILSVVGRRIAEVRLPRCRKRPILIAPSPATLRRRAVGQKIVAVDRAGKRVVLRLESGDAIVFEPRMAGLVLLGSPPTAEHLRLRIVVDDGQEVLFWDRRGLGLVRLVRQDEFEKHYGATKLGPDALALSWQELAARLASSRRPIKVALLDQAALAGVGNLYASELLHLARIDPRRPCNELSKAEWRRVHAAMLEVLHAAIKHEGSTLGDGTYRNALNEEGSYQNHHRVYDRAGQRCERCRRAEIERIVQAQRSTYFCARCQK